MCIGDFRFDYNFIGEIYIDFIKFDVIGKEGFIVLLFDLINVMCFFYLLSENDILIDIECYMCLVIRKIIVIVFVFNLIRVKVIIDFVVKLKKKVVCFGCLMV